MSARKRRAEYADSPALPRAYSEDEKVCLFSPSFINS